MIDSTLDLVGVSSSKRKAGLERHPVKEALKQCGRGRQSTTLYTKCVCVCVCVCVHACVRVCACTQCVRMYVPTYIQAEHCTVWLAVLCRLPLQYTSMLVRFSDDTL